MTTFTATLAPHKPLILASTSPYRRQQLATLGIPFVCQAPHCDETPLLGEDAATLVQRLAWQKAQSVSKHHDHTQAWVIGSDQVAMVDNTILGKPGNTNNAIKQLQQCAGRCVTFYTGLAVVHADSGFSHIEVVPYRVYFRDLSLPEIERYVEKEQPLQCAGSFKSEGLGISLFKHLEGEDPNALIGLPLIALCRILREAGWALP